MANKLKFSVLTLAILVLISWTQPSDARELKKNQKQILLDLHNMWRSKVARKGTPKRKMPTAADMTSMEWDDKLAEHAQEWAETCPGSKHGMTKFSDGGQTVALGQNMANGRRDHYTLAQLAFQWYDEYKYYRYSSAKCSGGTCGHFLTAIWAKSTRLGCGIAKCGDEDKVVCNYYEPYYTNLDPYISGKPCSKCPSSHSYCVSGLCTTCPSGNECKSNPSERWAGRNKDGIVERIPLSENQISTLNSGYRETVSGEKPIYGGAP